MARILLVDDEGALLKVLTSVLQVVGRHEVVSTAEATKAAELIKSEKFDLMISDIRMAPMNGMELLRLANKICPGMAVIMVTAFSSVETAVEARDLGVFDYVPKPFKVDELMKTVEMALKYEAEKNNLGNAEVEIHAVPHLGRIIANSASMQSVCDLIKRIASTEMSVLLTGPDGAGHTAVAETIHELSGRKDKPFVAMDCRGGNEQELANILFGGGDKVAAATRANQGILFLDHMDTLPIPVQDPLISMLKDRSFHTPDHSGKVSVDLRVIGSVSRDIDELIRKGLFRDELYRLFRGIKITVPPLSERKDDVLAIASLLTKQIGKGRGLPAVKLSPEACAVLNAYTWPRNIDELSAAISHAVDASEEGVITKASLPQKIVAACVDVKISNVPMGAEAYRCLNLKRLIKKMKRESLKKIVKEAGGDKRMAAKMLNISVADLNRELGEI